MMSYADELAAGVHEASTPVYADTKADLVRHYMEKYPARWQRQLSEDLAPIAGIGARSIARRFNPDRIQRPGSAVEQLQYQELGQQIGPVEFLPPENGYEITFVGEIRISKDCYPRAFTVNITGDEAYAFANHADGPDGMAPIREYFSWTGQADVPDDWCKEPEVEVRAA